MSDIFLSYKREEQSAARTLADALEKQGWTVWWDPKLRAGERFDDVIEAALKESKCVVVMWSKLSVNSRYVKDEATYALDRNKLVPVAIEDTALPFRFEGLHTARLVDWEGSREAPSFLKLVNDIATICDKPGTSPSAVAQRKNLTWFKSWLGSGRESYRGAILGLRRRHAAAVGMLITSLVVWWQWSLRQEVEPVPPPAPLPAAISQSAVIKGEDPKVSVGGKLGASNDPKKEKKPLAPGTVFRDRLRIGGETPEMVVVPAGSFQIGHVHGKGDAGEKPVHIVQISKPFALSLFEVTFDEYDMFANATKRKLPPDEGWGRGRSPVINVSWDEAQIYAKWLSEQTGTRYRLPSEAEWEYAARAGTKTGYWWGDSIGIGRANCDGCGSPWDKKVAAPVGSFNANSFGLFDTAGNEWEWVTDCWHENYIAAPSDGRPWKEENNEQCGQRVIRGGSWSGGPEHLRSSARDRINAGDRNGDVGFRLAQDID